MVNFILRNIWQRIILLVFISIISHAIVHLAPGEPALVDPSNPRMKPEDIQTTIYTVGKENGYKENLRDWFRLIYEVVFGVENGPRFGFFISFFGVQETKELIKSKLENV